MVNTGDILGEMKDELDGDIITEFVTGGAKNYGYKTSGNKWSGPTISDLTWSGSIFLLLLTVWR